MTAIGDKLKAAGYDTLGSEFCVRATEALKTHGSVREAWRGLGDTWGHVILTRIWTTCAGRLEKNWGTNAGLKPSGRCPPYGRGRRPASL